MNMFAWNLLLALIWAIALGPLSARNLLVGFVVGFLALAVASRLTPNSEQDNPNSSAAYATRVLRVVRFAAFFIKELVVANIRMTRFTLGPTRSLTPGIIAVPLEPMTDAELTLLANLVTLTPGTMSIDISTDRRSLFIHCMDASDPNTIRREVKQGFERRVREVLR
jgi:multicomponent Na+:H+ antiporter subunit E